MKRLKDRVAIVTGGAKGIGRAFSVGLAREGATVVVADVADGSETAALVEKAGATARVLEVDVSHPEATAKMAKAVADEWGRIDILINNAGIYPPQPFEELSFEDWRKVLSINLDGVFLCTKAVYPYMKERRFGRIVNISSGTVMLGTPNFAHYVTTKAGVIGFTRTLATEAGEHGITVNAIAPGLTATDTVKDGPLGGMFEQIVAMQAIKRQQEPEDLVGAMMFFVSDEASFVTGQTLAVDGGLVRH